MAYIEGTKRKDDFGNPTYQAGSNTLSQGTSTNTQQTNSKTPQVASTGSGSWTNLNQYVNANKGANNNTVNNLAKQGQEKASNVIREYGRPASNIQNAQKSYQNYNNIANDIQYIAPSNKDFETQLKQYQEKLYSANPNYTGVEYNQDLGNARALKNQTVNELESMQTQSGLTDYYRRNAPQNYSAGSNALDRFLTMNTSEGQSALSELQGYQNQIANYQEPVYDTTALDEYMGVSARIPKQIQDLQAQRKEYLDGLYKEKVFPPPIEPPKPPEPPELPKDTVYEKYNDSIFGNTQSITNQMYTDIKSLFNPDNWQIPINQNASQEYWDSYNYNNPQIPINENVNPNLRKKPAVNWMGV